MNSWPLHEVTFVIVDLETAGGKPHDAGITEIGAVKVRGGNILEDFSTLCHPGVPIPAFITELTGITDAHVADAPSVPFAVRSFLQWAQFPMDPATVLVAHNAGFDLSFLKQACLKHELVWPEPIVLDTLGLARKVLPRTDIANKKLSTLAQYFRAETTPTHRALDDAKATVTVLHGLIELAAGFGVQDLSGLLTFEGLHDRKSSTSIQEMDAV